MLSVRLGGEETIMSCSLEGGADDVVEGLVGMLLNSESPGVTVRVEHWLHESQSRELEGVGVVHASFSLASFSWERGLRTGGTPVNRTISSKDGVGLELRLRSQGSGDALRLLGKLKINRGGLEIPSPSRTSQSVPRS